MLRGLRLCAFMALGGLIATPAMALTKEEAIRAFLKLKAEVEALQEFRATVLRDSTGKLIGPVLGNSGNFRTGIGAVFIDFGDGTLWLEAKSTGFLFSSAVFFEDSNCEGTPYLANYDGDEIFGIPQAAVNAGLAYLSIDPDAPKEDIVALGQQNSLRECIVPNGECCDGVAASMIVLDLDAEFTPPFSLDF